MIGPQLVGLELGPIEHAWTERDCILYALGIGARHPRDLELLYERATARGLRVAPTFALTASTQMLPLLVEALAIDLRRLMHASQTLEIDRVPAPRGSCSVLRRVLGVLDKGRAAIIECEDVVSDETGTLATGRSQWWVEGAGGFGRRRAGNGSQPLLALPDRTADLRERSATSAEQAALYRLSGDLNPVHVDPEFARAAGQPRAFLHGLCTFGWLARELDRAAGPDRRLCSLGGRFAHPVFPGDDLLVEAWWDDQHAIATLRSGDRVVLGPASATFASR
jgi:acyl dehydratase